MRGNDERDLKGHAMLAKHVLSGLGVALAVSAVSGHPSAQEPSRLERLTISEPETVLEIDGRQLKGVPTRLAWAPDGSTLYVRVSQFDRWANEKASHAIVGLDGRTLSPANGEPPWAFRYWGWKSAPSSPADPKWRLSFDAREEQVRTTNVPMGGDIGGFMSDAGAGYDELAQKAILANQKTRFERLMLNGRVIDETVNTSLVPGRRFGWSPPSRAIIAVADRDGRLVLIARDGRTRTINGTRNVLLPAWSEDGTRIAFIERVKGDRYALRIVAVGRDSRQ